MAKLNRKQPLYLALRAWYAKSNKNAIWGIFGAIPMGLIIGYIITLAYNGGF